MDFDHSCCVTIKRCTQHIYVNGTIHGGKEKTNNEDDMQKVIEERKESKEIASKHSREAILNTANTFEILHLRDFARSRFSLRDFAHSRFFFRDFFCRDFTLRDFSLSSLFFSRFFFSRFCLSAF